jgi:WW domain
MKCVLLVVLISACHYVRTLAFTCNSDTGSLKVSSILTQSLQHKLACSTSLSAVMTFRDDRMMRNDPNKYIDNDPADSMNNAMNMWKNMFQRPKSFQPTKNPSTTVQQWVIDGWKEVQQSTIPDTDKMKSVSTTAVATNSKQQYHQPLASEGDWSAFVVPNTCHVYYYNVRTGTSCWEKPSTTFPIITRRMISNARGISMKSMIQQYVPSPIHIVSKDNWSKYVDHNKKFFYYNRVNGVSQRNPPQPNIFHQQQESTLQKLSTNTNRGMEKNNIGNACCPLATQGDWSAYLDRSRNMIYYFNSKTCQSVWEKPTSDFPPITTVPSTAKHLARDGEWSQYKALSDQPIFFYHHKTGQSQWERPDGFFTTENVVSTLLENLQRQWNATATDFEQRSTVFNGVMTAMLDSWNPSRTAATAIRRK